MRCPLRRHPLSQFVYSAAAVHFAAGSRRGGGKGPGLWRLGFNLLLLGTLEWPDDISFVLKWAGRGSGGGRKGGMRCDIGGYFFGGLRWQCSCPGDRPWTHTTHTHTTSTVSVTASSFSEPCRVRETEKRIIYFEPPSGESKRGERLTVHRPRKPSPSITQKTP